MLWDFCICTKRKVKASIGMPSWWSLCHSHGLIAEEAWQVFSVFPFYSEMKVLPHKVGDSQTLGGVQMSLRLSMVHRNWVVKW